MIKKLREAVKWENKHGFIDFMITGEHLTIRGLLREEHINKIKEIANKKLVSKDSRPFYIAHESGLGNSLIERYKSAGVINALKKCTSIINEEIGREWLILENKVLVRRTWPMSKYSAEKLESNASNLTWHQDTNEKHQAKAMIVLMCSLDNSFSIERPGLQLIDAAVKRFRGIYGYEGGKVAQCEKEIMQEHGVLKTVVPTLDKGDGIIFNGLTFHRTYSNEEMTGTRDALLIRIIRPCDRENFPKGEHITIKIK